MRSKYIESYFQEVHPVYPFIDRTAFEDKALSPQLEEFLSRDSAWCALYHAVLALGSLYHDCGSFVAFSGAAWEIFRVSLSLFTRLIFGRRTLVAAQAVTAMAISGLTYVSLPIEDVLITEAARIVTSLQMNRGEAGEINPEFQRTFWVIYSLESEFCFNTGRASAIPYHDISCPIPHTSLSLYSTFNWLQVLSSYALMISRIYERLFSVKAKSLSKEIRRTEALRAFEELENWKDLIPESFCPGMPIRSHRLGKSQEVALAIQIRFCYHNKAAAACTPSAIPNTKTPRRSACKRNVAKARLPSKSIIGTPSSVKSVSTCAETCLKSKQCMSFGYGEDKRCQLYEKNLKSLGVTSGRGKQASLFYDRKCYAYSECSK
ncbi:hypothetical protein QSH57_002179 [Fusarium oxysporum f. sp. vasinfectum]|nr:hypothetical protein QSH57_002179 [Fusarium oxysporum f. sp. vasinfectum]